MDNVDPVNIPKSLTKNQLEWWVLFTIAVAGKNAKQIEKKIRDLLLALDTMYYPGSVKPSFVKHASPFNLIDMAIVNNDLERIIRTFKLGKYTLLSKGFRSAIHLNVHNLTIEELEKVPGIGPKGARMIILYSDPAANCAVLDTHILKWLRSKGYDAPKSTPSGKKYLELEKVFQAEAKLAGKTVRELDTEVWKSYAKV